MKNLVRIFSIAIALFTVVVILAFFYINGDSAVKAAMNRINENMSSLQMTLKGDAIPTKSIARRTLYFYRPQSGIEVDGSLQDWSVAHEAAVRPGELQNRDPSNLTDDPQSWIYSDFFKEGTLGSSLSPYTINAIQFLPGQQRVKTIHAVPTLRLWFARDDGGSLYILGHMANVGSGRSVRLRLNIYDRDLKERVFTVLPDRGGNLRIYDALPAETTDVNYRFAEVLSEEALGQWWESGQDEFFELALHNMRQDDAVQPIVYAHMGDDTLFGFDPSDEKARFRPEEQALFFIGSPSPLPLNGEITTYPLAIRLRHFPYYEVSRDGLTLLSGPSGREANTETRLFWWLKPVYRLLLWVNDDIPLCSPPGSDAGVCFINTPRGYRLRLVETLEEDASSSVATEEPIVVYFSGMALIIPVVVLVNILLALAVRGRINAYGKLEKTNAELEQAHERLKQINHSLKSYDETFIHQAENHLYEANNEALAIASSKDAATQAEHLNNVRNSIALALERLVRSTDIFGYEDLATEALAEHGQHVGFDLYDSIADVVRTVFQTNDVDLHPTQWLGPRPVLNATGPGLEEGGTSRDGYFVEAIETIIQNAIDYRHPRNSRINVTLDMEQSWAVIKVSNRGPTVAKNHLPHVFDLGSRYTGATENKPAPAPQSEGKKHLGMGLFVVSQIIRAYRGTCRLENLPDGSGVVLIVRLPVTFGAVLVPHNV